MKLPRWMFAIGSGMVLGTAFVVLTAIGGRTAEAAEARKGGSSPRVRVEPAAAPPEHRLLAYGGVLRASEQGPLGFMAGGRLAERTVRAGQAVAAGEVLARLDATPWRHSRDEAQAALEAIRAQAEQGERDLERVAQLGSAATAEELEQRRSGLLALKAQRKRA